MQRACPEDEQCERDEGAAALAELLLSLYATSAISAKALCLLSLHATQAGVKHTDLEAWAFESKRSGNYLRHLRSRLPSAWDHHELSMLTVPVFDLHQRTTKTIRVAPIHHETLDDEVCRPCESDDVGQDNLEIFRKHPLREVLGDTRPVHACALYMDGIQYSKQNHVSKAESALGVFVYEIKSGRRILAAVLQKGQLCRCGCFGFCTIFPVLFYLEWSLGCAARGERPDKRWDLPPWPEGSTYGQLAKIDAKLKSRFIVTQTKGDWMEFSSTLSFASHSTFNSPCWICAATKRNMLDFCGATCHGHSWGLLADDWLEAERAAAEHHVWLTQRATGNIC